jgi:hypothetical protein
MLTAKVIELSVMFVLARSRVRIYAHSANWVDRHDLTLLAPDFCLSSKLTQGQSIDYSHEREKNGVVVPIFAG